MAYALIRDGAAEEIAPGIWFVDADGVQHPGDWADWDADRLDEVGLKFIVEPAPLAAGMLRISTALEVVAGLPQRTAVDEPIPLEDLKAAKLAAVETEYQARRQSPFSWDFGSIGTKDDLGVSHGAAGVQTLQMRDEPGRDDLKNWGFAFSAAQAAVVAGAPTTLVPLKATSNLWIQTTAAQAMQVLMTGDGTQPPAFGRGVAMLEARGVLKATVEAAANAAALAEIDVTAGWPA